MESGILPGSALERAEQDKVIVVSNRKQFSATSIHLSVNRFFEMRRILTGVRVPGPDTPFEDLYRELPGKEWVLSPDSLYAFESVESCFKSEGYMSEVNSRSSWARLGVSCYSIQDALAVPVEFRGNFLCCLKTMNTQVVLRRGDSPAQVRFSKNGPIPVLIEDSGQISVFTGPLTLDNRIKIYSGGVLDPHKKDEIESHFTTVEIDNGCAVNPRMFYLASSRESIKIPSEFMGYLHFSDYSGAVFPSRRPTGVTTHIVHANAPWIDPFPYFEGKITFENRPVVECEVRTGMEIATIRFIYLSEPFTSDNVSRYRGQQEAQISKSPHL